VNPERERPAMPELAKAIEKRFQAKA